ncbi:hypothetical protein C8Q70DRAFT_591790 [Cubamyces menziesii]|nr:hypothetical protein C8Q70DRAFT_591790 [Cubamyces menziesii]
MTSPRDSRITPPPRVRPSVNVLASHPSASPPDFPLFVFVAAGSPGETKIEINSISPISHPALHPLDGMYSTVRSLTPYDSGAERSCCRPLNHNTDLSNDPSPGPSDRDRPVEILTFVGLTGVSTHTYIAHFSMSASRISPNLAPTTMGRPYVRSMASPRRNSQSNSKGFTASPSRRFLCLLVFLHSHRSHPIVRVRIRYPPSSTDHQWPSTISKSQLLLFFAPGPTAGGGPLWSISPFYRTVPSFSLLDSLRRRRRP